MTAGSSGGARYEDSVVSLRDGVLTINRFYPWFGPKRIALRSVTSVREYDMTAATGRRRLWGSGDLVHWFNLDPGRHRKRQAFIIERGRRAKPVVTPNDPDAFRTALAAAGIRIRLSSKLNGGVV